MPRINIYIRNEDYEAWKAISDIPKWLHRHLQDDTMIVSSSDVPMTSENSMLKTVEKPIIGISRRVDTKKVIEMIENQEVCEHGSGRGFCKYSKCKNSQWNPKNRK